MKMLNTVLLLGIIVNVSQVTAGEMGSGRFLSENRKLKTEKVKWVGEVRDEISSHTTEHRHDLFFTRKDTGKTYRIVSPEITQLHHQTDKNYLVEIEAEKTPKFIFGGEDLIVKDFTVLADLGEAVPHQKAPPNRYRR